MLWPMSTITATANFGAELAATQSNPPEWVQLFPVGRGHSRRIDARDGRSWTANPDAVVAAFNANRAPLPVDYEHAQDHRAPSGLAAPAAGWVVELKNKAGAIWGKVEWTPQAAAMIVSREYRFLSPSFTHEKGDHQKPGRILRLLGAGLVNRPALEMTALSHITPTLQHQEKNMKAIAKALGLAGDADEKAILAEISRRDAFSTAICQALKLDPAEAGEKATLAAIETLAADTETALAAAKAAPAAGEVAALEQSLADTTKALAALQQKDAAREIEAALDKAAAKGKITPASRETYRAMCQSEGGLARFTELVETLPVICAPSTLDERKAEIHSDDAPDPVELAAKARKYQDEQAAIGRTITISEAIETVRTQK